MTRILDDWLSHYLQLVDNTEPPHLFKIWCGIGAIVCTLQRRCWLDWQGMVFPNMYIVLVGPAAARKGTAMQPVKQLLQAIDIPLAPQATSTERFLARMSQVRLDMNPKLEGYDTNVMAPYTVFSDELTSFIGFREEALIGYLCDLYDCHSTWTYDTHKHGEQTICGVLLNIIGATTPETLQMSFPKSAIGGGLTSRMMMVYGGSKSKLVTFPKYTPSQQTLHGKLQVDLANIATMQGRFTPTQGWLDAYQKFYLLQESHPPTLDSEFDKYIGRRQIHLIKMSMALSASRSNDMQLTLPDIERSIDILLATEQHMNKVFSRFGRLDYSQYFPAIVEVVQRYQKVLYTMLQARFRKDLRKEELDEMLTAAAAQKVLKQVIEKGKVYWVYTPEEHQAWRDAPNNGNDQPKEQSDE